MMNRRCKGWSVLRFAAVFALMIVVWASLCLGTEPAYRVEILDVYPGIGEEYSMVFDTCRYSISVQGNGLARKVWVLQVRDGKGDWDSTDISPQGVSWTTQSGGAQKIVPGQHKIEVFLFEESTSLPKANEEAGTVPAGWLPKTMDALAYTVGPVALPARTDGIWVSSVPLGCPVYAAKRTDVLGSNGKVDIDRLKSHFVGYAPVMVPAAQGRYAVAVEVGLDEEIEFLEDESEASYSVSRNGEKKWYGRIFDVTKDSGELAVVIGLFAPVGWSYTRLQEDLYPGGDNFAPARQAVEQIASDARQAGWPVPAADLDAMLNLLRCGGKVIWAGAWAAGQQKIVVITKTPDGYDSSRLTLRR